MRKCCSSLSLRIGGHRIVRQRGKLLHGVFDGLAGGFLHVQGGLVTSLSWSAVNFTGTVHLRQRAGCRALRRGRGLVEAACHVQQVFFRRSGRVAGEDSVTSQVLRIAHAGTPRGKQRDGCGAQQRDRVDQAEHVADRTHRRADAAKHVLDLAALLQQHLQRPLAGTGATSQCR